MTTDPVTSIYDCQVAILPDTKDVRAVTPDLNDRGYGIYWHANPVAGATRAKGGKEHITHVRLAHADIDPPKDGSAWDKDAVLVKLIEQGASVVVDSGNGLQAVWFVRPGATVDQIEGVNRGILQFFGADPTTWNADRLLRVPGTINWPNAAKKARGLVPVPASEVYRSDLVYEVGTLAAHFPYVAPPEKTGPDEIEPIPYELIPLPERASAGLYDLVYHPPGVDRSVDVSRCVTLMAREKFTDAEILGVILNPALPISAHCLDQGNPERAARRKCSLAAAHRFDPNRAFPDEVELPPQVLPEPVIHTKARKAGFKLRDGGVMFQDDQLDYFEGYVYVTSMDKVMTPSGKLWGQSRFDNRMGGHAFMISANNEGNPTKSAWEAFLRNQRYEAPTADDTCFRPEEPSMALIDEGNMVLVNAYIPIETPRTKGDPAPFLDHLSRILPVKRDREILLSYMASCVQNIGFKAQWWPVIIGTKGNGKTLLLTIMIYAIGEQYSHIPNSSKMTRSGINFNGWMRNKLFLGLEEIYSSQRRDFLEEFKPYVTNRRLPIEAKGEDEFTGDNRANGIMLTNHVDGVPIDNDERRYAPFITAQTTEEECIRDGLTSSYFVDLWDWLDGKGKYANMGKSYGLRVVNDFLHTFKPIPEFDPAQLATRRPRTSSFDLAVAAGMGSVEQEIIAAIEEERLGFAGGWVSGKALDDLIDRTRSRVPRNKRRDLMRSLGYDWHPHLPDGKPTSAVQPDGTRCKLYVRVGSPQSAITEPGAIAREYTSAQIETKLGA